MICFSVRYSRFKYLQNRLLMPSTCLQTSIFVVDDVRLRILVNIFESSQKSLPKELRKFHKNLATTWWPKEHQVNTEIILPNVEKFKRFCQRISKSFWKVHENLFESRITPRKTKNNNTRCIRIKRDLETFINSRKEATRNPLSDFIEKNRSKIVERILFLIYCYLSRNWATLRRTARWNWKARQRTKCPPPTSMEKQHSILWGLPLSWNLLVSTKINLQWSRSWSGMHPHIRRAESSAVRVFRLLLAIAL